MKQPDFETSYAAITRRDATFEGSLFFGVITTGIFCRPTCSARRPKRENVMFFMNTSEALAHGFRPCKRCHPMRAPGEMPPVIHALLDEINTNPSQPLRDKDLRARGLSPPSIRRWFERHHNMTFQAFQRMLRLNLSYQGLASGQSVTNAALEAGFESLSGFNTRFKDIVGTAPGRVAKSGTPIVFERFSSPLGPMIAGVYQKQLCLLEFTDRRGLEAELKDLKRRLDTVILPGRSPVIDETRAQLESYFAGDLQDFELPLFTPGTAFQQAVWQSLERIPYGTTRTYKQQAVSLDKAGALRAVARANGMNRIAIVIPCHRVIGSDGSLTGYAGGLQRKRWLLDHELENVTEPR